MLATGCYRLLAELRALQASMLGITLLNDEHELLVGCEPPSSSAPCVCALVVAIASPKCSLTSTQHFGKMPENTLASRVFPLRLVRPASSDGGATK